MDVELVRRAQTGDAAAQNVLYESMYKRVYYLALRLTGSAEDAEDAAQETFLAAFRALPGLENPNAFEGWLFQIAANKSRNLLKKKGQDADLNEDDDGLTLLDTLPERDEALLPAEAVDSAEQRRMLLEIVNSLPEAQRQCVILFYYSELSVQQIAELLDCSEGTVKSRLNYARQKIKEKILETEKRHGIRLHVLAPIELLFAKDFDAITASIPVATLGGAAAAVGGSQSAGGTAAGSAAKTGLFAAAKTKVIAGVAAAAVLAGGGAVLYHNQQGDVVKFADLGMEHNMHVLLNIPGGDPIWAEDLEEIYQVGFIGDGMNIFVHGYWQGDGTISTAPGTCSVERFDDLKYFGDGTTLYISIVDPLYPVDEEEILEIVPYATFVYHDGNDLPER